MKLIGPIASGWGGVLMPADPRETVVVRMSANGADHALNALGNRTLCGMVVVIQPTGHGLPDCVPCLTVEGGA